MTLLNRESRLDEFIVRLLQFLCGFDNPVLKRFVEMPDLPQQAIFFYSILPHAIKHAIELGRQLLNLRGACHRCLTR